MAVVEALVSKVLEKLTSMAIEGLQHEVSLVLNVKEEVESLTSNYEAIRAVLADAEKRHWKEATIKHWLHKLMDSSYEIDDVLDEWSTAIQTSEGIKKQEDDSPMTNCRKVCPCIPSFCCGRKEEVALHQRRNIAERIQQLRIKLENIAKERDLLNLVPVVLIQSVGQPVTASGVNILEVQRMTTSQIDQSEVRGRKQEKDKVMDKLLRIEVQVNEGGGINQVVESRLHVISILGMGGIGKTTLAKLVFNDDSVANCFHEKIWVCVSEPFDETRIVKAILESLIGSTPNMSELETMVKRLRELLKDKKFLLVLDDVWNEDITKWNSLKSSLMCGLPGSKVLVTTRKMPVATAMGCTENDILSLELLSTNECWEVFSRIAFVNKKPKVHGELEPVGREIVERCRGLPLAAKTLGGVLLFKETREEWEGVLNSELWRIDEAERHLYAPLKLSYYDLPLPLRQCFTYCAAFPKDHEIDKAQLIKMWMAQGFLNKKGTWSCDEELEMVGEEYFRNLALRSLFQDFEKNDEDDSIRSCKIHDLVHDFARDVAMGECFSAEINGAQMLGQLESSLKKARHAWIQVTPHFLFSKFPFPSVQKLRSLVAVDGRGSLIGEALPMLFDELTSLRSLDLNDCGIKDIPATINRLIHLRRLNLSGNRELRELPETLGELRNLQTLDVRDCFELSRLPSGIWDLVNLRHLHIERLYGSYFIPKGITRLTSLRTLDVFKVGHKDNYIYSTGGAAAAAAAASLGDLKFLSHLQGGLRITGLGNVRDQDIKEAKQAQLLKKKQGITRLHLDFDREVVGKREARDKPDETLIETLEPSSNLQELEIRNYKGIKLFPNWMQLMSNLRRLALVSCWNCEHLPPLGKLQSLESLIVEYMPCVKKVGVEFLGVEISASSSSSVVVAFPKLTTLVFDRMHKWEGWDDVWMKTDYEEGDIVIMPCLRSFSFSDCPKLKALPHHLRKIQIKEPDNKRFRGRF